MIRKTRILLIVLLALAQISACPTGGRQVRFTVVNKSGMSIEISLNAKNNEKTYYLRVSEGDRLSPVEKKFTIMADTYTSSVYYVELWDPVYGSQCNSAGQTLDMTHNVAITVFPCNERPVNAGEAPSNIKYNGVNRKGTKQKVTPVSNQVGAMRRLFDLPCTDLTKIPQSGINQKGRLVVLAM